MRALAAFVMRGPVQAAVVAVLTASLPLLFWISAAVVGLVILRLGATTGLNIALWAALPAFGWLWVGQDPTSLVVLLETAAMALVLRRTVAWQWAMVCGIGLALLAGWLIPTLLPGLLQKLVATGTEFYRQLNPEFAASLGDQLEPLVRSMMVGSMAASQLAIAVGCLALARGWQAKLFNPGGLRKEFHGFRLDGPVCLALVGAMVLLPQLGANAALSTMVLGLPLLIAGVALIHGLVAARGAGGIWLALFYVALLILGPSLMVLLVVIAIIDSWVDFRRRLSAQ
ncbi:hypothetical protein QQM79_16760 [Marinobacteraceae bacterium S3BR75-40.1]